MMHDQNLVRSPYSPRLRETHLRSFAVCAAAFGLAGFALLLHWHLRFQERLAAAAAGKVPAVELVVQRVADQSDADGHWPGVWFADQRFDDHPFRDSNRDWHPSPGDKVSAFRFGPDDYYIPISDNGKFGWGMAIALTIALLPLSIVIIRSRRSKLHAEISV
jgi:hypothetical protein